MPASSTAVRPLRAWSVVAAGTAVNLCLGILYAWSVWKSALVETPTRPAGTPLTGVNAGWHALTDAQSTWAYSVCGVVFALSMVPAGRLQDRRGPRLSATLGGVCLGAGCVVAGVSRSFEGLVLGFGVLGGIGMGLGYAAATPAAVAWFGPDRRGLVAGLVVAGYGAAAVYISPLAKHLIGEFGITGSFVGLGAFFAVAVVGMAQLLATPAKPTAPPVSLSDTLPKVAGMSPREMLATWQFYALVVLFAASAQSGLLVIANAAPILAKTATAGGFLAENAWLLASFGGVVNALGRVGTGVYSDAIGRRGAYTLNGLAAVACLWLTPSVMQSGSVPLLFAVVGVAYWQYGGGLALMPALTADLFGANQLGAKYGLVFLGWGAAFLVPLVAGYVRDSTGSLDAAFYGSGLAMLLAVGLSRALRGPRGEERKSPA